MVIKQHYPFDVKKFPDDDDILLNEADLKRKNVVYCRKEILKQMKCTQWAKDEYISSGMDPDNQGQWIHYHLQKCYTPYMDAMGCVVDIADKEIQQMKQDAGPEGWNFLKTKFIQDAARTMGENKARTLWEYSTNIKEIHEKSRQRDGPLFGEQPAATTNNNNDAKNNSHMEVERMLRMIKEQEVRERMKKEEEKEKKPFWRFGF